MSIVNFEKRKSKSKKPFNGLDYDQIREEYMALSLPEFMMESKKITEQIDQICQQEHELISFAMIEIEARLLIITEILTEINMRK